MFFSVLFSSFHLKLKTIICHGPSVGGLVSVGAHREQSEEKKKKGKRESGEELRKQTDGICKRRG